MTRVLGISASLRNARHGRGSDQLVSEIACLDSTEALACYLAQQTRLMVEDLIAAGRAEGKPFDEIYKTLRRMAGDRGLSNSEAVLAAALWGASREGAEIDHLSLGVHFPPSGKVRIPKCCSPSCAPRTAF